MDNNWNDDTDNIGNDFSSSEDYVEDMMQDGRFVDEFGEPEELDFGQGAR
jgi:hypothetical protein